jgi:CRISPR/Cas system endoribonuclease Cas6 (RAMP superfamily)
LSELDYDLKGNAIVMHIDEDDVTSPMKLHYIQSPAKLVADSDTVSINDVCCSAISTYGAYAYALSSGELQKATLLLGEFNNFLKTYGISVEVDKNESQRTV